MLILVSGGAASGKSEYAERLAVEAGAGPLVYVATMEVWGEEDRLRVERHRELRRGKGFLTVEAPRRLWEAEIPEGSTVLLECLSNLCANECFGPEGFAGARERILRGVEHLLTHCVHVVIVTNELFSDGVTYPPETEAYLALLADLNRTLAARAHQVWEVCCGIPLAQPLMKWRPTKVSLV